MGKYLNKVCKHGYALMLFNPGNIIEEIRKAHAEEGFSTFEVSIDKQTFV